MGHQKGQMAVRISSPAHTPQAQRKLSKYFSSRDPHPLCHPASSLPDLTQRKDAQERLQHQEHGRRATGMVSRGSLLKRNLLLSISPIFQMVSSGKFLRRGRTVLLARTHSYMQSPTREHSQEPLKTLIRAAFQSPTASQADGG